MGSHVLAVAKDFIGFHYLVVYYGKEFHNSSNALLRKMEEEHVLANEKCCKQKPE